MTNPNIPPEIADKRLSDHEIRDNAEHGTPDARAMAKEIIALRAASSPAMARVEKERDVARLTVAQWDRMHVVCKETLEGRPDEFLPMVCSRVKGELDVATAKLAAIAEVVSKGGLEHANSCRGPDGCVCEIAEIRNILEHAAPAPVRISPEVRETILRALRQSNVTDLERAIERFSASGSEPNGAYIDRMNATRARLKDAIAFVEALP